MSEYFINLRNFETTNVFLQSLGLFQKNTSMKRLKKFINTCSKLTCLYQFKKGLSFFKKILKVSNIHSFFSFPVAILAVILMFYINENPKKFRLVITLILQDFSIKTSSGEIFNGKFHQWKQGWQTQIGKGGHFRIHFFASNMENENFVWLLCGLKCELHTQLFNSFVTPVVTVRNSFWVTFNKKHHLFIYQF